MYTETRTLSIIIPRISHNFSISVAVIFLLLLISYPYRIHNRAEADRLP